MASTYLTRTQSMGNRTTFTFSAWVKRSSLGEQNLITVGTSGTSRTQFHFQGQDALQFYNNDGGSVNMYIKTNRLFRDLSAWYHIVLRFDTTQSTASDRIRFYVNGEEETSLATNTIPSEDADNTQFNYNGIVADIGRRHYDATGYFDGSMSHVHFCDGTAYDATAFGETDATTGEWVGKTSPSVTYGTNGFFILKDGNGITDQSGEGNDFTLGGGTLTDLKDNPENVFATLNPLDNFYSASTFANGNTSQTSNAGAYGWVPSTLGMTTGKFYVECKQTGFSGGSNYNLIGITGSQNDASTHHLGQIAYTAGYYAQGNVYNQSGSLTSTYASYTTNDIIGVALDLDNNKLYFSKNGVWQNSGDPTSGATGTGALNITAPSDMTGATATGVYRFASGDYGNTVVVNNSWNFGNGYFGTTAITTNSGNGYEGAEGSSKFNYTVPTGYSALNTKGLNL